MQPALIGCVAAAVLLAAGHFRPRVRQPLLRDGFAADLAHALVNGVLLDLPLALALRAVARGVEDALGMPGHQPLTNVPLWQQAMVFLFVGDLLKWSIHVMHHRVPFLWRLRQVHHSPLTARRIAKCRGSASPASSRRRVTAPT